MWFKELAFIQSYGLFTVFNNFMVVVEEPPETFMHTSGGRPHLNAEGDLSIELLLKLLRLENIQ